MEKLSNERERDVARERTLSPSPAGERNAYYILIDRDEKNRIRSSTRRARDKEMAEKTSHPATAAFHCAIADHPVVGIGDTLRRARDEYIIARPLVLFDVTRRTRADIWGTRGSSRTAETDSGYLTLRKTQQLRVTLLR